MLALGIRSTSNQESIATEAPYPNPRKVEYGPVFDLLRGDPRLQGVPVLFLTGLPERAETARAATGVHEVLAKPFDIDDLVEHAERLMSGVKTPVAA